MLVHPLYQLETLGSVEKYQSAQVLPSKRFDRSKLCDIFSSLESAMAQACHIYTLTTNIPQACHIYTLTPKKCSAQSTNGLAAPSVPIDTLLDRLKTTVTEIPPYTPGEESLVWILLVAASRSTKFEHAAFFTSQLTELMSRIGYDNSGRMFLSESIRFFC